MVRGLGVTARFYTIFPWLYTIFPWLYTIFPWINTVCVGR